MSIPDNELIAEVLLYSEGFKNAKDLAKKIVQIFLLSKQLLSQQQHYDWGLRALKTILTVSGELMQQSQASDGNQEAVLLIKAIRINTMSKLTYSDGKKFEKLLNDVFPGVECLDIQYPELKLAI
jgi:dynein heavy chain 2